MRPFIIGFAALTLWYSRALASPSVSLHLSVPKVVDGVDNLLVTTAVENTGAETVKLLRDPRSVLSSAPTHAFHIEGENGKPDFIGKSVAYSPEMIVRRGAVSDFVTLPPGQSFGLVHELAGVYNFTRAGTGEFKLKAPNPLLYVSSNGELGIIEANTSSIIFRIEGRLTSAKRLVNSVSPRRLQKRITYIGCSSTRQSQILATANAANSYVSSSNVYLASMTSTSVRYTTWFGTYTTARFTIVKSKFSSLTGDATTATYDCSTCTDPSALAYAYPSETGKIYLCPGFWDLPSTGFDSKAETILRQLLLFVGVNFYVYGQSACKALAASNPVLTVTNADSYVYFAINDPPLP